ncbi:MAG: hypothetical protein K6F49_01745 [Saccharofermentans sp.]|nr:hypothetical protein [Saccharofermentans sp.]
MANIQRNDTVEEIDLLKLAQALWDKIWIIISCATIGAAIAFSYSFFLITPQYEASALLYVNNNSVDLGNTKLSITSGDLTAANGLIDTYTVILTSRNTLESVITDSSLPYEYSELVEKVSAESVNNTAVFKITARDKDPEMAAHIVNSILRILPERISTIVEGSSVEIIDYAVPPMEPASPNIPKITAIGALLGIVASCAIIVLRFLMDSIIRDEEYLLETYKNIPILTVIPDLNVEDSSGYYYGYGKTKSVTREGDK